MIENHEEPGRTRLTLAQKCCMNSAAEQGIHHHSHIINLEYSSVLITAATINVTDPIW
jgi:hypothetical protein